MDCQAIFTEAQEAAKAAVRGARHLENPNAFDCGFAWVIVQPATCPFIRGLKKVAKAHIAAVLAGMPVVDGRAERLVAQEARTVYGWRRDYGGGGWEFFMLGAREHTGQSVAVFEAGAVAFAAVLDRYGIPAQVGSRLD